MTAFSTFRRRFVRGLQADFTLLSFSRAFSQLNDEIYKCDPDSTPDVASVES